MRLFGFLFIVFICLTGCRSDQADILIRSENIYTGERDSEKIAGIIVIKNDKISYVGPDKNIDANVVIQANDYVVVPGFIDPHTHSLNELTSADPNIRRNINYQYQGVTTVITGNDGFGNPNIKAQALSFEGNGIGTNVALFVGHGELRRSVMGDADRRPTELELETMKVVLEQGMMDGALGLSTGLFYAPGSYAETDEIINLANVAAQFDGIYDTHIRDEASYNIGLEASIEEAIQIGRASVIRVHIAHIKALGVDVWGKSESIIDLIETAQGEGIKITADQYPWMASGTRISNALLPRWLKADGPEEYNKRLNDTDLYQRIFFETKENLRKRGGAHAVLLTSGKENWIGKTLHELSVELGKSPVDTSIFIARNGDARIASFNMNADDIKRFMAQDWVMTSSDGSTGHPRKYASYPKKYWDYVRGYKAITFSDYIYRSSGLVADTFGLCKRGYIAKDHYADIAILNLSDFKPIADFQNPKELSSGVKYLIVNGEIVINDGEGQDVLPGSFLERCRGK